MMTNEQFMLHAEEFDKLIKIKTAKGLTPMFPSGSSHGVSRREYIATHIMAAIVADPEARDLNFEQMVSTALEGTDALLKGLADLDNTPGASV